MQKARRHGIKPLRPLVSTRFQVLFHSPSGVLFTFPSRYWFTIGRQGVLSLTGWSPRVPTGFPVPGRTQVPVKEDHVVFAYGAITLCGVNFHSLRLTHDFVTYRPAGRRIQTGPPTPRRQRPPPITSSRFGLIPFRSPLLRESRFLSFPPAT